MASTVNPDKVFRTVTLEGGALDGNAVDVQVGGSTVAAITFAGGITVSSFTTSGNMTLGEGDNVVVGTTTGSQIGTAASQKLGLWGATPVVQQSHIADPSGGATQDAEARTAIASINAVLAATGITAAS